MGTELMGGDLLRKYKQARNIERKLRRRILNQDKFLIYLMIASVIAYLIASFVIAYMFAYLITLFVRERE